MNISIMTIDLLIIICKYLDYKSFTSILKVEKNLCNNKSIRLQVKERYKIKSAQVIQNAWKVYKIQKPTLLEFLQEF